MFQYAVSSYTQTLDALITARSRAAPAHNDKVLVVIQPKTPAQSPLPYTVEERARIQKVVPPESLLQLHESSMYVTDGSDATVDNVLSMLPEASVVHFACHGVQSTEDPLESAVLLYDGKLTLSRMMHRESPNASIAILSACHSAAGDQQQPDEMMHLGAAMLTAGFRAVIATMW
jgi:CHAT domain-containing protein